MSSFAKWPSNNIFHVPSLGFSPCISSPCYTIPFSFMPPKLPVQRALNKSSICRLLFFWNPSAVFRAIVPVNINSLNCEYLGIPVTKCPFSKNREIAPLITNDNAPTAIIWIINIFAAFVHIFEDIVNSRSASPMRSFKITNSTDVLASAIGRLSKPKVSAYDAPFRSTSAATKPHSAAFRGIPILPNNRPKTDLFFAHINKSGIFYHDIYYDIDRSL